MKPATQALVIFLLLETLTLGCVTRTTRKTVFDEESTQVLLRGKSRSGEPLDQGYDHPATISGVRLAHILSRIDVRAKSKKDAKRGPAIPIESLYTIADGVAQALLKADASQEVVALSVKRGKHFAIFDRYYLTSMAVYVKDDLLYVHLGKVGWRIPPRRRENLPEPGLGEVTTSFTALPSDAMNVVDPNSVAIAWRDPVFKKPTRTRITPGGKVVRRVILMESEDPEEEDLSANQIPANAMAGTLRKLADLEDSRRRGEITETDYDLRRRAIIQADPASQESEQTGGE